MKNPIHFTKMHGLGNDYIYVNADEYNIPDPSAAALKWSRPHLGIGSDGLVLISRSDVADFRMRMFNADGSEGKMCGNASRCIARYVYEKGLTDKTSITLETASGIKTLEIHLKQCKVEEVTVDMGLPQLSSKTQLATEDGTLDHSDLSWDGHSGTFVSMGNPHLVVFTDDVMGIELEKIGPVIEKHEIFPEGTNVEFAEKLEDGSLRMRVWERGSGITMACGTGACATAVAACKTGLCKDGAVIRMDGGELKIRWDAEDGHVYMTGPAEFVFEGDIEL